MKDHHHREWKAKMKSKYPDLTEEQLERGYATGKNPSKQSDKQ